MQQIIGQPQTIKQVNRAIVFREIKNNPGISQPEIAAKSGLSLQTVNKIVGALETDGAIKCSGAIKHTGGRRAKSYEVNEDSDYIASVYIQGEQFLAKITNSAEKTLVRKTYRFDDCKSWTDNLFSIIEDLLCQVNREKVQIIGVAVPGTVTENRVSNIPAIPEWEGINLKSTLAKRFGCRIYIENDIKAATMRAYQSHIHGKDGSLVYVSVLNNIGSAIILNQVLYNSGKCFAGELAYMAMDERGQTEQRCGSADRQLAELLSQNDKDGLIALLARLLVNVSCVIDPDQIVLATPHLGEKDVPGLKREMSRYIQAEYIPKLIIEEIIPEDNLNGMISICSKRLDKSMQIVKR